MSRKLFGALAFSLCCIAHANLSAAVVGDLVSGSNTFQDATFTGGGEVIFQAGAATVADPGVEFNLLAGIFDVDFQEDSLTMTFLNNDSLAVDLYPAGTFDRYYFGFDNHTVDSISITGGATELTNGLTVGLLAPGFELNVADPLGTGIPLPQVYDNGGFFLEFGEGTNYQDGTLGQTVSFGFSTTAVPEPSSAMLLCGISGASLLRRRRRK